MPVVNCDLLVIGAGPYGVATAAYAKSRGLDVIVCGKFMEFWKRSMPDRLLLRSDEKWHMDAEQIHTFKGFIKEAGYTKQQIEPIPVSVFLEYADWFRDRKKLEIRDCYATRLSESEGAFKAKTDSGHAIRAKRVVVAEVGSERAGAVRGAWGRSGSSPPGALVVPEGSERQRRNLRSDRSREGKPKSGRNPGPPQQRKGIRG